MKYNNKLTVVSIVLMIISSVFVVLIPAESIKLSNITICIFTGFIVAFIMSLFGYLHEKSNVLTSLYMYLSETHRRLSHAEKMTADFLLHISDKKDFRNLLQDEYTQLDKILNSKNNRIVEYHCFYTKSKLFICLSEIMGLTNRISSLLLNVSKTKEVGLQYEIFKIQSQEVRNCIPSNTDANYLDTIKEMLFLIHEIEIGLLTETDRLGQELYKLYGFKMKWNDITT